MMFTFMTMNVLNNRTEKEEKLQPQILNIALKEFAILRQKRADSGFTETG